MEQEQRLAQREASCQQQEAQLNIYAQEKANLEALKAEIQPRTEVLETKEQQLREQEKLLSKREMAKPCYRHWASDSAW